MSIARRLSLSAAGCILTLQLSGCGVGYYWQAASGHLELMKARRPVAEVVADPETPEALQVKLAATGQMLEFAHGELLLPDNGSYRKYADLGRPYVVWNVFAAPEFSVEPRSWCFLVIGCISYRGYFEEARALDFAAGLDGDDIFVGGVSAYSTLGRFADPLLNTMMYLPESRLAGLIFHELAHQKLYIKDDSTFNESFASFVEREGLFRWLTVTGTASDICRHQVWLGRRAQAQKLLGDARAELAELYAQELPDDDKRRAKQRVLNVLNDRYQELRGTWPGPPWFDGWFGPDLNNARLVALAVYDEYAPAFALLLDRQGGDMEAFYRRAEELGALAGDARQAELQKLLAVAEATRPSARHPDGSCRAPISARYRPGSRAVSGRAIAP